MRRNARALILVALLLVVAGLVLGFQTISIGGFQRGGDTLLGLNFGLDLQGGSHLVYQAKPAIDPNTGQPMEVTQEDMESLRRIIERRINGSGLGDPVIQVLGDDRLLIQLPGVDDPERAKDIIGQTAQLEFKHRKLNVPLDLAQAGIITPADDVVSISVGTLKEVQDAIQPAATPAPGQTDVQPGAETTQPEATAQPEAQAPSEPAQSEATPQSEEDEVLPGAGGSTPPEEGQPEATPQPEEDAEAAKTPVLIFEFTEEAAQRVDTLITELSNSILTPTSPGVPPSRLEISLEGNESLKWDVLGLQIRKMGENSTRYAVPFPPNAGGDDETPLTIEEARQIVGDTPTVSFVEIQGKVDEDFGLSGEHLARAYAGLHAQTGRPIINIEFNAEGTRLFGELTSRIAGSPTDSIAIFLDGQELISPTVTEPITSGTAFIQGRDFTIERATDIALLLEGGRLPVPIGEPIQERDVDAILGSDSLAKSVAAGLVGIALVFLFMTLYYRVPGLVASVALVIYAVLMLAIFKLLPVTLTLSGVAGVILSIGMAVDANVLIFERMKDELRNGRTLMSAINIGFNRAWLAIRDSNVSTLITSVILFYFANQLGTTIVQGFAVTLSIGVLLSMFTAIVVSRTFLRVIASTRLSRKLGLFMPSGSGELPQTQAASSVVQRS